MSFFKGWSLIRLRKSGSVTSVRMSRGGIHFYTILASDSGFEFLFQTGKDRWSTISPSLAKRILDNNRQGKTGKIASNRMEFLNLAIGGAGGMGSHWMPSTRRTYHDRETAIKIELQVLDEAWANRLQDEDE